MSTKALAVWLTLASPGLGTQLACSRAEPRQPGAASPGQVNAPGPAANGGAPSSTRATSSRIEFTDAPFEQLYPIFLTRKLKAGPKAALWARYAGKWVRWTGRVVSFSANGLTIKQLPHTVTFDVSLWISAADRPALRRRLKIGDTITYIGRLDSYDDIFRTLYLVNGAVM